MFLEAEVRSLKHEIPIKSTIVEETLKQLVGAVSMMIVDEENKKLKAFLVRKGTDIELLQETINKQETIAREIQAQRYPL